MSYTYYIDTNATLAAVEVYKYKGAYPSFDELIIAHPVAEPGDYATVAENDRVLLYVWVEDSWVLPINKLMTSEEVKTLYEQNENTNAFTDANLVKLNSVEVGAQVNTVTSVAGKTGAVALVKGDVGLGNADNTSDADKPISTATQTALNDKAPLASPTLTGNPTAPTPTATDNSTSIATTAFVRAAMALDISRSVDTRFTEYRTVSTSAPSGVPRDGEEWIVVD